MKKWIFIIIVIAVASISYAFYQHPKITSYSRPAPSDGYGDMNGDGYVSYGVSVYENDPFFAYNFFKDKITPDVNGDGYCNRTDINLITSNFGKTGSPFWIPEDVDGSGKIDGMDMLYVLYFYNTSVSSTPENQERINILNKVINANITFSPDELKRRIDVDGDKILTFNDVYLIIQYAKGEIDKFPVQHGNAPPIAKLDKSKYTMHDNSNITFDGSQSYDPDGDTIQYKWVIEIPKPDGLYYYDSGWCYENKITLHINLGLPQHTTVSGGIYLYVKDFNATSSTFSSIIVYPSSGNPVADFTYYPAHPKVGEIVYLNSTSYDPDGYISKYYWYIDGRLATNYWMSNITYVFTNAGTHSIKLEVWDNDYNKATISKNITVSMPTPPPPPPPASHNIFIPAMLIFLFAIGGVSYSFIRRKW